MAHDRGPDHPGEVPATVAECINVAEVMALGAARLPTEVRSYYLAGAGDEQTVADNVAAFARRRLRPRVLADLEGLTAATTVLGRPVSMPVGIAPAAEHGLAHPEGELATARAAARAGAVFCCPTASSAPIEAVAAAAGSPRWFQLYAGEDRAATEGLIARALDAGYEAIVLTADVAIVGYRDREMAARRRHPQSPYYDGHWGHLATGFDLTRTGFRSTWADLPWILDACCGRPLVIKGVMTAEDAKRAVSGGASAVWVSNHGGRQLDRSPATLDVLAEAAAAAGGAEVYFDGGVRRGVDAAMALALGARCVFVGRPALFGLAAGGDEGVEAVLAMLRRELLIALALCGAASVDKLGPASVAAGGTGR